jgi:hypothetical protein
VGDPICPLDVLNDLAGGVSLDHTQFESVDVPPPFLLTEDIERAASLALVPEQPSAPVLDPTIKPRLMEALKQQKQQKQTYGVEAVEPHDYLQWLVEQTDEILVGQEGTSLHDRMSRVWDNLGFSIQQKLEMAVKYSGGSEDVTKFTEAVVIWENAYATVLAWEKAYKEYKDVIRMEMNSITKAQSLERFRMQLETAERNVVEVTTTLKMQFNDDFVIRRKKAADLMEMRRAKLNSLLQQQGYPPLPPLSQ